MARINAAFFLLLVSGTDAFSGSGEFVKRIPSSKLFDPKKSGHMMMIDHLSRRARSEGSSRRRCLPHTSSGSGDLARQLHRTENRQTPPPSPQRENEHGLPLWRFLHDHEVIVDRNTVDAATSAPSATTMVAPIAAKLVSFAKNTVATVALAAVLTPAVFFGEVAFSPPTAGTGGGAGSVTAVAPAFADLEPLPLKSYSEEFSSGLAPVNTVRGLWRTRETRSDGSLLPQEGGRLGQKGICGGRLTFKGFVGAGKGTVEYKGCGDREGKGRWLTKPKNIVNGRITLSARWSIKFADGTSLLYRGDVVQDAEAQGTALRVDAGGAAAMGGPAFERPDAHIRGEVLRPVKSIQGTLTEKKIGQFEADLIELPTDEDKL